MDIEEIKIKIAEDKKKGTISYRRYPVRFVFLEMSNNTQNEIMDLVKNTSGELLDLSDYIMNREDGWMTKSRFIQIVKKETSKFKDTYVLGFSELIRFFSRKEIETTVLSLFDIENQNVTDENVFQRRIYFICFSMIDSVRSMLNKSFQRLALLDPFINSDYEENGSYREICFVSNDYANNIKNNKICSSYEWLGLWRHSELLDFSTPIWCCSDNLYEWHKKASPDNAFQIDIVTNTKDYLKKAYGLDIEFTYADDDRKFWNKLKDSCVERNDNSVYKLIGSELGVDLHSSAALAGKFLSSDDAYVRWLIKHYVNAYFSYSYLSEIIKSLNSNSNEEFLNLVWEKGYFTTNVNYLNERLSIIKELNKYVDAVVPENEIRNIIIEGLRIELRADIQFDLKLEVVSKQNNRDISELRKCILSYYLQTFKPAYTGFSNTEKEFVINLASNLVLDKAEIRNIYPALYFYLYGTAENRFSGDDEWKSYLYAYRHSKIIGKDTDDLRKYYKLGKANAKNVYDMYYGHPKQDELVKRYGNGSDIYIIDGVGAEYLPLLAELITGKGYCIDTVTYGVCHLPSITQVNKSYLSQLQYKDWILDFDREVIHGQDKQTGTGETYKTSTNLRKAFNILENIVKRIICESEGKTIVITSDHGATARSKWTYPEDKKYSFSDADHEGRCCKIPNKGEFQDTDDYIVYEDTVNPGIAYLISLNEISLNNKPRYENHGGATPEEMLVPVIVAVPCSFDTNRSYKVIDKKLEVSGLDKIVSFVIMPKPNGVYVEESDGETHTLNMEGDIYSTELKSGKEQDIKVVVDGKEYKFHTENKSKRNMEGDDGFDD